MKTYLALLILFFSQVMLAQTPNYKSLDFWAAHPDKIDPSDVKIPTADLKNVDVFFIYPTLYWQENYTSFSASLADQALNKQIEETAIFHQASVFSEQANVYAPFYRQMHLDGYYLKDPSKKEEAKIAFDQAYQDVFQAFLHYLHYDNNGRPFVIAAHSQGTNHAEKLLKEVILQVPYYRDRLIVAYLIGMPIQNNIQSLPPCENETQTGCFVSWRTFGNDSIPLIKGDTIVCTNPINWTTNGTASTKKEHDGIRFKKGKTKAKKSIIAQTKDGYLDIEITKWPLNKIYKWGNFHAADYNLFWPNIKNNFEVRVSEYYKKYPKS